MRRTVGTVCLILVTMGSMLMLPATRCEAAQADVTIHLKLNEDPPRIWVQEGGKFVGLCRKEQAGSEKHCTANQIKWKLLVAGGSWDTDLDRVYILNAPNHPTCFGPDPVAIFTEHNQVKESGAPSFACIDDKYGTYWPYVIEYRHDGAWRTSTDPGGIIFP